MGEFRIISSMDVGSLIKAANKIGVNKDNFITILQENNVYMLIYYYESGREN